MRGLSFMADGEFYAVDVTLVQKVTRNMAVTPVPAAPDAVVGIANMKGKVVTVLSISELLGRPKEKNVKSNRRRFGDIRENREIRSINSVVFKPFTDGGDQMGLLIEKPGDLVDIAENKITPMNAAAETDEQRFCISGTAEIDGKLYRVLNINSIINKFNNGGDNSADGMAPGGPNND